MIGLCSLRGDRRRWSVIWSAVTVSATSLISPDDDAAVIFECIVFGAPAVCARGRLAIGNSCCCCLLRRFHSLGMNFFFVIEDSAAFKIEFRWTNMKTMETMLHNQTVRREKWFTLEYVEQTSFLPQKSVFSLWCDGMAWAYIILFDYYAG